MRPFIYLITAILVSALSVQVNGWRKIVRGTYAKPCEFPHIVYITTKKDGHYYVCGGSIIDNKHVLTAGHCMAGNVERVTVNMGSTDRTKMPWSIPVSHFEKNSGYAHVSGTVVNDVAVLTLSRSVPFSPCVKPIRMANPGEKFVGVCTVAGWGRTAFNRPTSTKLLRAQVPLMDKATCKRRARVIYDQHICAGSGRSHDSTTCKGDSGGPLMCTSAVDGRRVLAGLVSYGWRCNTGLGIFAKVSYFLPWINRMRNRH